VKARQDIISGVLPRGGLLQLLGAPKVGKTILGLNLALAIAGGNDFLCWPTFAGGVVYLSGEGGIELLFERLGRMAPKGGTELDRIYLWAPEPGGLRLRLDNPAHRRALARECIKRGVIAVIVDPLALFHGCDENDSTSMRALVQGLLDLGQETQAGIVLVHHTRKTGPRSRSGSPEEGRGSSIVHGAVDASLVLKAQGDSVVATPQLRWSPSPAAMILKLDEETLTFSVVGEASHGGRKLDADSLLAVFREASSLRLGYEELRTRTRCSTRTIQDNVKVLVADGLIEEGRDGMRKVWSIVDEEALS
jgi:hypothetical protein